MIRRLTATLAFSLVAGAAQGGRPLPPDWNQPVRVLETIAGATRTAAAARLERCIDDRSRCDGYRGAALVMLVTKTAPAAAAAPMRRILAKSDVDDALVDVAREALALSGDPAPLKAALAAAPNLGGARVLASVGDYTLDDYVLRGLAEPGNVCWIAENAEPWLRPAAPHRAEFIRALVEKVVIDPRQPLAAACVIEAFERSSDAVEEVVVAAVQAYALQAFVTETDGGFGFKAAASRVVQRWWPRLDRAAVSTALLRTLVTSGDGDTWTAANQAARSLDLVAEPLRAADESAEVPSLWLRTSGDEAVEPDLAALRRKFSPAWIDEFDALSPNDRYALLERLRARERGAVDAARKIAAIRERHADDAGFALRQLLADLSPAPDREKLLDAQFAAADDLQKTALAARDPRRYGARATDAWRTALADADPWRRYAALANAAVFCKVTPPIASPLLADTSRLAAASAQAEAALGGCPLREASR